MQERALWRLVSDEYNRRSSQQSITVVFPVTTCSSHLPPTCNHLKLWLSSMPPNQSTELECSYLSSKGTPLEKIIFCSGHCPNTGGGGFCPNFWPISIHICMFLGHHYHHDYHFNHHYYSISSYAQNVVFDVRKKRTTLPKLGGGGRGNLGNGRNNFFTSFFPLITNANLQCEL